MSLKQMIHDEIVRPALSGITPTVLGRVIKVRSKRLVDIEVSDPHSAENVRVYENVIVSGAEGTVSKVPDNAAVWVEFLGHDRNTPRIIGIAGTWNYDTDRRDRRNRSNVFEWVNPDQNQSSCGQRIPGALARRK